MQAWRLTGGRRCTRWIDWWFWFFCTVMPPHPLPVPCIISFLLLRILQLIISKVGVGANSFSYKINSIIIKPCKFDLAFSLLSEKLYTQFEIWLCYPGKRNSQFFLRKFSEKLVWKGLRHPVSMHIYTYGTLCWLDGAFLSNWLNLPFSLSQTANFTLQPAFCW